KFVRREDAFTARPQKQSPFFAKLAPASLAASPKGLFRGHENLGIQKKLMMESLERSQGACKCIIITIMIILIRTRDDLMRFVVVWRGWARGDLESLRKGHRCDLYGAVFPVPEGQRAEALAELVLGKTAVADRVPR